MQYIVPSLYLVLYRIFSQTIDYQWFEKIKLLLFLKTTKLWR